MERIEALAADPAIVAKAREIRAEVGAGRTVLLGVDRLDYTKGIDNRLRAFHELLTSGRHDVDDIVLIQISVPSR